MRCSQQGSKVQEESIIRLSLGRCRVDMMCGTVLLSVFPGFRHFRREGSEP